MVKAVIQKDRSWLWIPVCSQLLPSLQSHSWTLGYILLCFEVQHHNSVGRVSFQLGMELKAFTLSKLCASCSRCRTFWVKLGWRSVTGMWGRGWGVYLTLRGTFLLLRSLTLQPCMGIIIIIKENHSRKIIITFSSGILRTTSALITSPSSVCTERQKPSLKVCREKREKCNTDTGRGV